MATKTNSERAREYASKRASSQIASTSTTNRNSDSLRQKNLAKNIRFDTLQSDLTSLATTIGNAYSGWQTPETMENTRSSIQSMYERLGKYQEYYKQYGGTDLSELHNSYKSVLDEWDTLASDYASHKNAESYTNEKTKLRDLYGMSADEVKTKWEQAKILDDANKGYNLVSEQSGKVFSDADKKIYEEGLKREEAKREEYLKGKGYTYDELQKSVGNYVSGDIAYTTSKGQNITWKDLYENTKYQEDHNARYKEISSFGDFEHYTNIGKNIENPTFEEVEKKRSFWNPSPGIQNPVQYVLDNRDNIVFGNIMGDSGAYGDLVYHEILPEELSIYNFYLGQEIEGVAEKGTADAYLKSIYDRLKDRHENKLTAGLSAYADQHPWIASGVSVFQNLASGVEYLGDSAKYIASGMQGEMDDNSMARYSSAIRGTVSDKVDWEIGNWDAFDFVYNTTMSGIDSAVAMGTLGMGGGAALGLSAAAQGTNDALDRGLDSKHAFWNGIASGVFEGLFESVSIGNFKSLKDLPVDGFKTFAKNIGKSMLVNASEETLTEVANVLYDTIANGDFSQYETDIRAYMSAGMSEEDAKRKVALEQGARIAEAGASGALMGFGFGGFAGGTSFYNTSSTGKSIRANERTSDMFDIASNPEIGSAYETYTQYANQGINAENAKNAQLGRLYMEAESDARNTLSDKKATDLQKSMALKNLGKLSIVETKNELKKKAAEEFNVGEETKVTKTGETIATKNIKVEGDKITIATENGKVSVDDVTLSERDAELAFVAKEIAKENGEDIANLFLEQYDGKTNVEEYQNSFNMVMEYAKGDFTFEEMMKHKGSLSATEVSKIYEETVIKAYKEQQTKIEKLIQDTADQKFYKGSIDESAITNKVWKKLDTRQRKAITFIKGLAKATGMNLVLTYNPDSKTGGSFNKTTNTITIDVAKFKNNIGMLKETIIPTMSHEMTHWMEEKSPELYRKLSDLVFSTLQEADGLDETARLALEYKKHKAKGREYSNKDLRSEIVARACEDILSMSEQGQKLFDSLSESEKQTLGAKIKEILHNLMDMIKKMLGTYKSDTYEAKALQKYQDKLQEIAKIWDEMLLKSVVANQALEKSGVFENRESADGEVQFKMRETVEVTKDLIAVHNASESQIIEAVNRGHFIMPSVAVTNKNHTAFGDFSVVFYKEAIDPETNKSNKLYGADAWTPTQTTLKINPKFDNAKTLDAVKYIKKSIGQNWSQIFNVDSTQFKKTITDAKGSLYDAYSENIGMQTAYAMKNGLISSLPMNNGRVDVDALKNSLDEKLNKDEVWREYKKWLGEISNTIITEYDKASTQDILDSMKAQPNTAKVFKLSESGELTVPAAEYKSIDEMRQNKHRLSENAEESAKAVGAEFISWANNLSNRIGVDAKSIVNAINSSFDSRYNINGIVKSFNENGVSITNADAKSIQELYKKAVELPTLYFEAKPDGTVGFERVAMIAVPDNASNEVKSLLDENGIHYKVYEEGNVESRLNVLNSSKNVKFSDRDYTINTSMTMDEAKQMIQRAFVLGGIEEFYEGEYKNGDEWLRGEGASEVALHIENEYTLTEKYLNKIPSYIDGDFYVEDILEAYLKGTLVGKEKPKAKRLDISKEYRINDKRFYSPQRIKDAKKLLQVAMQRVTDKNRQEVSNARAKILLFAHNKGASELLGMTQAELNKKLRAWSNYSAKARDISRRFNNGVADSNKWTGIENCSWLYKGTVTTKDLESLVKDVKGASSDYEKMYIARTMLALDTHIDWSWLSFEFDTKDGVNKSKFGGKNCLGYYTNDSRKIVVSHNQPNTVAHEMGHALDYQWARDLGYNSTALTEVSRLTERITDANEKQFFENFRIFLDSLTDNGDIRNEYVQNPKEVFARFVARFVQWVDNTGTGRNTYNTETSYYNDKFTASHYIEFVKLLQEKAMLDARKMEVESNEDVLYSDRYTEQEYRDYGWARANGILNEGQNEDYRSKFADAVNGYVKFNKTKRGEFIIPVSDIYDSRMEGIDNILVFAMGNIDNPIITSIIEIYEFDETRLDDTRRFIYESERRGIQQKTGEAFERYYAYDFRLGSEQQGTFLSSFGFGEDNRIGGRNRQGIETDEEGTESVSLFSDRETESVYDILGERDRILKENEQFRKEIENLKERVELEKKVTNGTVLNNNSLLAAAAHLRNIANSNMDKVELAKALKEVYFFILTSKELTWEEVFERCYNVADTMLKEAKPKVEVNDYYKRILADIRNSRISLSDSQKSEAQHIFDKNWNRRFFGRVIITDSGIGIESKWQEWAELYPDIFRTDISDGDMIGELYDIINSLQEASETVMEYDETEQRRWLANEIYNQFWNVSTITTTADKYDKQIKLLKAKHRSYMAEVREDYKTRMDEKLKAQHKADKEKANELYKKLHERKDKEIALAKERGKERLNKYKDNAERKTRIQRITANVLSLNEMLVKNSKDKHVPEILKDPVITLIQSIDFSSKRLLDKGEATKRDYAFAKALGKVKDMMVDATNAHDELIELYGHGLDDDIKTMVKNVDALMELVDGNEFVLNRMSLIDLQTLDKMVKTIKVAVSKMNKFHTLNHARGIASLSQESVSYLDSLGKGKIYDGLRGGAKKLLNWGNALPYYVFKRFGSGGMKVYEALQDGWDKFAFNIKKIIDYTNSVYTSKEVKEWSEDVKTFKIKIPTDLESNKQQYQEVQMTVPQIMSMYCLAKREQAKGHLFGGGIRVADFKNKKGEIVSQAEGIIFTESDILQIFDSLTDRQKEVADKLQRFMNTVCSDWGNEVSMARFGYKAFGEDNYFPIQSDDNNLSVNDATEQPNSLFKLLNMAFTKSTIDKANNRIIVGDIFDVFAQHTSDMAKYNALALPVLDSFKWYNYKEKLYTTEDKFITKGVKQSIENAFGKDGKNYFTTFLKDINGQQEVSRDTLGKGFFSNAKIASVGMNLRVMLLQPTSYVRASAVIDNKYLLKALGHKPKIKRAETHCGIALWKSMGYYDTNIQRGVEAQIKHNERLKDKITDWSMKGAELADKVTWGYLWNACELEIRDTRKDLKVGSEEFYTEIGKRLREIIYATQVVDSTMTRSQMMRSSDGRDKMLTAFASEPTLAYNMLQDAYMGLTLDARRMGKKEAWKKNGKKVVRTLYAYTMTNALAALIESAFDAFRDDDDEEMDMLLFMKYYFSNFASDMSIGSKIPYVKELYSFVQGFGSSRSDTQWMENMTKAITTWYKIFNGKKNAPTTAIKYSIKAISDLSGIPVYNVYRDMMATFNKLDLFTADDLNEMFDDIFN